MRFLIDANLPRSAVGLLVGLGHFVDFERDIGLASAPDEAIARRTQESAAALLTRDLDFSDIRRYPPADYNGIPVLMPRPSVIFSVPRAGEMPGAARSQTAKTRSR